MICERCRAGQMAEYDKMIERGSEKVRLSGQKCDRCGYTHLDSDDDVWSAVGL